MASSSSALAVGASVKAGCDVGAVAALLGWLTGLLPSAATFLTVTWMALRIWEMDTVQGWRTPKKKKRRASTRRRTSPKKKRATKREE